MAVVDEIAVKLGIQTGDLKAALLDAGASVKKFSTDSTQSSDSFKQSLGGLKSGMRELKELFVAGGAIEAVKSFFELAIKSAEANTDATNENAAAVRAFGDDLKSLHGSAGDMAMNVVGFFNRIGEGIGTAMRATKEYFEATVLGHAENLAAFEQAEESEKKANEMEHAFAEEKKKYGAELVQLSQQIQAERQKETDALEKQKPIQIQLSDLQADMAKQQEIMNSAHATVVDRRKAELKLLQDQTAEAQLQAELTKQARDDAIQRNKEQLDAQLKGLTNEQQIKLLTDDIKSGEAIIAAQKKAGADTTVLEAQQKDLIAKLTKTQGEEEAKRLETKKKIAGSVQEEIEMLTLQHKVTLGIATGPEELRLQQIRQQRQERQIELQLEDLAAKKISGELTPAEMQRFSELQKQKAKIDEQLGATTDLITAQQELAKNVSVQAGEQTAVTGQLREQKDLIDYINGHPVNPTGTGTGTGAPKPNNPDDKKWIKDGGSPMGLHNLGSIASDTLQAKLKQLQDQIFQGQLDWQQNGYSGVGGSTFENTHWDLYAQAGSIQSELAFRQKIQSAFAAGGRSAALAAFTSNGGNALNFDQAYANMSSWGSGDSQTGQQLKQIANGITTVTNILANTLGNAPQSGPG